MQTYTNKSSALRGGKRQFKDAPFEVVKENDRWIAIAACVASDEVLTELSNNQQAPATGEFEMSDIAAIIAAAAAALALAQDAQVEANDLAIQTKEDIKGFTDSVTDAKTNLKKAKDYQSALPADADDAKKAEAQSLVDGWAAALAEREASVVTAKAAAKAAKDALAVANKALKEAQKANDKANKPAKEVKEKHVTEVRNGARKPKAGGLCDAAWVLFDEMSAALGRTVKMAEALPLAVQRGQNVGNVRAEYNVWRKFYGFEVAGRATAAELNALAAIYPGVPEFENAKTEADSEAEAAAKKAEEKAAAEAKKVEEKAAKDAKKAADKLAREQKKAQEKAEKEAKKAAEKAAKEAAKAEAAAAPAEAAPASAE